MIYQLHRVDRTDPLTNIIQAHLAYNAETVVVPGDILQHLFRHFRSDNRFLDYSTEQPNGFDSRFVAMFFLADDGQIVRVQSHIPQQGTGKLAMRAKWRMAESASMPITDDAEEDAYVRAEIEAHLESFGDVMFGEIYDIRENDHIKEPDSIMLALYILETS